MDTRVQRSRWYSTLLIIICLSACTTMPPTSAPPLSPELSWHDRQIILSRIQNWQLNGKLAVQTAQDSGSASVNWVQNNKQYTISLLGPLGTGGFKLTRQLTGVSLETSDGKHYTANNPEQLLAEQWGFHLPISSLRYWIRGLPVSGISYTKQLDIHHRLMTLTQQGWQIQFLSYSKVGVIDLPNKMVIASPLLKAKLIIYRWDV